MGYIGGLQLSLPQLLHAQIGKSPKAKSIIHIFLSGGISSQDSFDYKKFNSPEYRGPFSGIETKIKGEYFGELFKDTAAIADKINVIRSMTHGEAAHERGTHNMFTGYKPSPALKYPSIGSVVSHELGMQKNIPPYVAIPNHPLPIADPEVAGTGYLSAAFGPFGLGADPADANFIVKDLMRPKDVSDNSFDRRKSLLSITNENFTNSQQADNVKSMSEFYDKAYQLISSKEAVKAFDIKSEPDKIRDKYGRNSAGQRLLMARRLIEAGTRVVSVAYGSWDHHSNLKQAYLQNAPDFDKAYAALITDLAERGLLNETLVIVTSEFSRTPKINATNGRDHWPRVFSTLIAGGGTTKGNFYGSSDTLGGEPDNNPTTPADLFATVYHLLGIDPEKALMTSDLRPVKIIYEGTIINSII